MKHLTFRILAAMVVLFASFSAWAQTCQNKDELAEPARKAIETAAQQAFDQTASGNVQGLQASAVPSLQSNLAASPVLLTITKTLLPAPNRNSAAFIFLIPELIPVPTALFIAASLALTG